MESHTRYANDPFDPKRGRGYLEQKGCTGGNCRVAARYDAAACGTNDGSRKRKERRCGFVLSNVRVALEKALAGTGDLNTLLREADEAADKQIAAEKNK
jgi:hypothetical protein